MLHNLNCLVFSLEISLIVFVVCLQLVVSNEIYGLSHVNGRSKRSSVNQKGSNPRQSESRRQARQTSRSETTIQQQHELLIDQPAYRQEEKSNFASVAETKVDCSKLPTGSRQAGSKDCTNVKTIETAVFVDTALDNKFTGLSGGLVDLNKLIMTIMNQVQLLFKYSSLKVPINIKLVLIEHMNMIKGTLPNTENGDIDGYLSNFCNWQQAKLEKEKRLWWDHAILLSG